MASGLFYDEQGRDVTMDYLTDVLDSSTESTPIFDALKSETESRKMTDVREPVAYKHQELVDGGRDLYLNTIVAQYGKACPYSVEVTRPTESRWAKFKEWIRA